MRAVQHSALDGLVQQARQSPRGRMHSNIHLSHEELAQRVFNAICVDSYIRPHRHRLDARDETLLAMRGRMALLLFGDGGDVVETVLISPESDLAANLGAVVSPEEWHTIVSIDEGSMLLEIKAGPFDPTAAKEFAPWAPAEGSPDAALYLESLRRIALG